MSGIILAQLYAGDKFELDQFIMQLGKWNIRLKRQIYNL